MWGFFEAVLSNEGIDIRYVEPQNTFEFEGGQSEHKHCEKNIFLLKDGIYNRKTDDPYGRIGLPYGSSVIINYFVLVTVALLKSFFGISLSTLFFALRNIIHSAFSLYSAIP